MEENGKNSKTSNERKRGRRKLIENYKKSDKLERKKNKKRKQEN